MSAQNRVESGCTLTVGASLPDWVPTGARLYLSHTAKGLSLRALARSNGCHASTVLRQVRRFENRRDDPLVDDALSRLDMALRHPPPHISRSIPTWPIRLAVPRPVRLPPLVRPTTCFMCSASLTDRARSLLSRRICPKR
jgi:lambda repressor-like predicted transcriptional regulator